MNSRPEPHENNRRSEDVLRFETQPEFEAWLESNHEQSPAVWLEIAKKGAPEPTLSYAEAIEAALCFGWVDGQKARGDDEHWLQRFTRRAPRSRWSRINREKAEALFAAERMRPAGRVQVEKARTDGRWDKAYEGQRAASVPDDLQRELDAGSCGGLSIRFARCG